MAPINFHPLDHHLDPNKLMVDLGKQLSTSPPVDTLTPLFMPSASTLDWRTDKEKTETAQEAWLTSSSSF